MDLFLNNFEVHAYVLNWRLQRRRKQYGNCYKMPAEWDFSVLGKLFWSLNNGVCFFIKGWTLNID